MKSKAAVDTSAFIAAVCAWHEKHAATARLLEELLADKIELTLSAHTLLEAYSVLTRLPAPHRMRPADAFELIERNAGLFTETEDPAAVRGLLRDWAGEAVAGGRIYDLYILESARRAGARVFVTLNARDVAGFEGGLRIAVP